MCLSQSESNAHMKKRKDDKETSGSSAGLWCVVSEGVIMQSRCMDSGGKPLKSILRKIRKRPGNDRQTDQVKAQKKPRVLPFSFVK